MDMVLNVKERWRYDPQAWRVAPVAGGPGCLAALVERKQLALLKGDDVCGRATRALVTFPCGNTKASWDDRLTLDPLHLELVVEAWSGEQRLVLASEECPAKDGVAAIVQVLPDCGWQMMAERRP